MASASPAQNSSKYFSVEATHDQIHAYIPKGTPISPDVAKWTLSQFEDYLKSIGFVGQVRDADFQALVQAASKSPKGYSKDLMVIHGTPAEPTTPGKFSWLNPPHLARDQLIKDQPFLKVTEPVEGKAGVTVRGQPTGASRDKLKPMLKKIAKEFVRSEDGTIIALQSGQAVLSNDELTFSPVYKIEKPASKEFLKAEFFSSVHVTSDLPALVNWKVHGDIHVDGHWSAHNVEVLGNATAASGIQTNMQGVLKIGGNLKSSYIQRSIIQCEGNVTVESAVLLSEIVCRGDFICKGSPGAVMGSKLKCHGALQVNRIGSDRSVHTEIRILRNPEGKKSNIAMLCQGTKMHVFENKFIQQFDGAFETPD